MLKIENLDIQDLAGKIGSSNTECFKIWLAKYWKFKISKFKLWFAKYWEFQILIIYNNEKISFQNSRIVLSSIENVTFGLPGEVFKIPGKSRFEYSRFGLPYIEHARFGY